MKPNVLLIMVDQMRADCLSMLDHPVVDTPNLDHLAKSGVLFENAYAATPSCVPARASLMTGMSQGTTGRVGYQDKVPFNYKHTIADEFTKAGYHTQSVGKMHVYPTRNLMGFHNVILHDGYLHHNRFKFNTPLTESADYVDDYIVWMRSQLNGSIDLNDLGLDCNASTVARPWHLEEKYHPTNWVTMNSIDFIRRRDPSKPFFLKMSYVRPHPPFDPPQAFYDMYKDLDMPVPPVGDWANAEDPGRSGLSPIADQGIVPEHRMHRAQAAYYALITHIDYEIGRFLNTLQEFGQLNNTVIIFASDHGELLGDHNLFRKSMPYEGSTNVPFILADPGNNLGLKRNTINDSVVEMRDIMPTLLDAAGVDIPYTVEGKSILPLARGNKEGWREYLHGEHSYGDRSFHYITDGKDKYIWFSQTGEEQYFNLEKDPLELHNAINDDEYQEQIKKHRKQLIKELDGREEGYSDGEKLIVGQQPKSTLSHAALPQK